MLIKSSIVILRIQKKEDFKEDAKRQATNILIRYEDKTQFVQNGKRLGIVNLDLRILR